MNAPADNDLVDAVIAVLSRIFALDRERSRIDRSTELIGSLPGFDSHSVVALMLELEDEFDMTFEDDEVSADLFTSVGTLADFVAEKLTLQKNCG